MALSISKESKFLAKHSIIYGIGNFMGRIVSFLLIPVYTRFLSPHDYGIKELVALSTDVIGILLATSISSAIYRFYFEYEDTKERNEVISTAIIAIGIIGLAALSGLYFCTDFMATYILDNSNLNYFFMISFTSMWFQSLNNIGYNYLRANQQSLKFVGLSFAKMIVTISLNIYTVCILKIGVLGILISTLTTSILVNFLFMIPLVIRIKLRFSLTKFKEMIKFGLPVVPSQLGAFVVHLSDRYFLKAYSSISDAGLYSLGYRFGVLPANFISEPFNQTWQPRRFELYKQDESEKIFGRIFTYFLCLIVFAGLGVSVLTKDLLMIVADPKFWPAYRVVPIIVLASTVFSLHYHLNMGILIAKKTKYLAYINFSNAFLITGLNFWLIPRYGVFGAAYATLFAFLYKIVLTYYFSSRYYKIFFEVNRILKISLAACILYFFTLFLNFGSPYFSFTIKLSIVLLYPLVLLILNFFSNTEKSHIRRYAMGVINHFKRS